MDWTKPFVLLDDAAAGRARLFTAFRGAVTADKPADVPAALAAMRAALAGGDHLAGHLDYEAGHGLEARLGALPPGERPALWMGRFGPPAALDADGLDALFAGTGQALVGDVAPAVTAAWHAAAVARAQALIAAGDIYQANLTFPAHVPVRGHPAAVYRAIRARARAPYGALLFTGERWVLSFSPELFFTLAGGVLTARPMKGTAAREAEVEADADAAARLRADPKNRAENLMITDLLRNDLARVAEAGSVRVPALFEVEAYPSVWQMTSTVTARLAAGRDAVDVLAAIFPCGSVTGAPKIRAQEVIGALETGPRGGYCGAVGVLEPEGGAAFNVAIRTLAIEPGEDRAVLGLGSGIVADSEAAGEWAECLAKARFLRAAAPETLIETMRVEAGAVLRLELHLARMAASAARFGFAWDEALVRARIAAATSHGGAGRLRVLLGDRGACCATLSALPAVPDPPVAVALAPLPVAADDWRLRHKSGDRGFYDAARRASGTFEVVFVRPDGRVTEGSFTNVFVKREGVLLTPPLGDGLLPGVLRAELLATKKAAESSLSAADLEHGFFVGNSLRGLMPARLARWP